MVVVCLLDGSLFVNSPVRLTSAVKHAVDALDGVAYIVPPNELHHHSMGDWAINYPKRPIMRVVGFG